MTLLPCPFCGSTNIDPEGWASTDRAGPACDDCAGSAETAEIWNKRPDTERLRVLLNECAVRLFGEGPSRDPLYAKIRAACNQ